MKAGTDDKFAEPPDPTTEPTEDAEGNGPRRWYRPRVLGASAYAIVIIFQRERSASLGADKSRALQAERDGHCGKVELELVPAEDVFGCTKRVRL